MGSFYQYIHIAFQASFACITVGLIVGAVAERIRFSAVLIFVVIWLTFAYLPIAHMVWAGGFLAQDGALDFAGGLWFISTPPLPVWSGLIWWVNVPASAKKPLNRIICRWSLPERQSFTLAGLALTPAPPARLMKLPLLLSSTRLSRPLVRCCWTFGEWALRGKPSLLGVSSGAIAGLVAITPACGYVGVGGALIIGVIGGLAGLWG